MNLNIYTYRIQNFLERAKDILILIRREPDLDMTAAGLALYLSLSQRGKKVTVACPDKMSIAQSSLFAVDKVTDELGRGGKNLVISFPYVEGSIEKVSYNIENNRFNLIIEPRGEGNLLNKDNVEFTTSGGDVNNFDLIITLGISDFSDLGKFQDSHRRFLEEKPVILISTTGNHVSFGTIQIISPSSSSISEIVTLLLSKLNLPIDRDTASNLLKGIKDKTRNFEKASADAFEATAVCMRKTGEEVRQTILSQPPQPQHMQRSFGTGKAPPDWLKPKIFRSSSSNIDDSDKGTIL